MVTRTRWSSARHTTLSRPGLAIALLALLLSLVGVPSSAALDAQAPGLTVDKQVVTHQSVASSSISSPSMTTSQAGELILAFIMSDGSATTKQSFSSVTGGGLSWRLRQRSNARRGTSEIWQAVAPTAVSNMVVTANRSSGSYVGSMVVTAFIGADTSVNGATNRRRRPQRRAHRHPVTHQGRVVGVGRWQRLGPGCRAHRRCEPDHGRRVPGARWKHVLGAAANRPEHRREPHPGHHQRHRADQRQVESRGHRDPARDRDQPADRYDPAGDQRRGGECQSARRRQRHLDDQRARQHSGGLRRDVGVRDRHDAQRCADNLAQPGAERAHRQHDVPLPSAIGRRLRQCATSPDATFTTAAPSSFNPGNPTGSAPVPPGMGLEDVSQPDHVIGDGTAASCTSAAVLSAVTAGGVITFNCGPDPITITLTQTAKVLNSTAEARHRWRRQGDAFRRQRQPYPLCRYV